MTALANHPFIRGGKQHGIRYEPDAYEYESARQESLEPITIYAEYEEIPVDSVRLQKRIAKNRKNRKSQMILLAGLGSLMAVTATGAALWMTGSFSSESGTNPEQSIEKEMAKAPEPIQKAAITNLPEIVGGQIPNDYPGIYPGEQVVLYHLAPMVNDRLVEERSPDGCIWLRVVGKQAGILAYPKIGANNQQVCPAGVRGVVPLKARMTKNTLPEEPGSMLKIVDILDAQTGVSIISKTVFQPAEPQGIQPGTTVASVTNIPSQQTPSRPAVISTAAEPRPAPPVPGMRNVGSAAVPVLPPPGYYNPGVVPRPAIAQAPVQARAQQRPLGPLEPVRRTEPYIPPADDVMVPITGKGNNPEGDLRAIRPGASLQSGGVTPSQRPQPATNPNEVMVSISGKE